MAAFGRARPNGRRRLTVVIVASGGKIWPGGDRGHSTGRRARGFTHQSRPAASEALWRFEQQVLP
jgi:hypothetical protein